MAELEKLGTPTVFIVTKYFDASAKINAKSAGLSNISLAKLPMAAVPPPKEIKETNLGDKVADEIISSFLQRILDSQKSEELLDEEITFNGINYRDASEKMEKFFLNNCWGDGFPLVPPTKEAVDRMLEGTDLSPDDVVGLVKPSGAEATVRKIAVNAVMAGCLPQYMPVLIAAVEAITDPKFDLLGIQCTADGVAPLLVISGEKLVEQININDSFSTFGPGWRSNSTIGRAVRLIMINIGHAWPGKPDMKPIGSPFKYVMCIAENEAAYGGVWEPIRVAEGYTHDQPTVSVYPIVSWGVEYMPPEVASSHKVVEFLTHQAKVKYDREAVNWGMDNLIILSGTTFEAIQRDGHSRAEIQKMLYDSAQTNCFDFFRGKEPTTEAGAIGVPEWIVDKCKANPEASAPLYYSPESIKIVVAGCPPAGPAILVYTGTWGWGPAYFVTKQIQLPENWDIVLEKNKGWETPIVK